MVEILLRTSLQSLLSAGLSLLMGFFIAVFVLTEFSIRSRHWAIALLLWPSFMPAYFWYMVTASKAGTSVWLLVFIQVLMNMGWVAWRLQGFFSDQLSRSLELCFVEGTSWSRMIFKVLLPLSRSQLWHLGVTVFLFCFGNYSLAMLLAGSSWSLDVYLVQMWQQGQGVLPTLLIAGGLWLVMLLFYWNAPVTFLKPETYIKNFAIWKTDYGKYFVLLMLLTPLTFLYLFFKDIAWNYFFYLIPWLEVMDSFLVGLITGWFLWMFSASSLWSWSSNRLHFFFTSMVSPPVSLLGLGLSLLEVRGAGELIITALGFALFLWPLLYRVFVAPYRDALIQQIQTAMVCGSSRLNTMIRVVLPQVNQSLFAMSAIGAFWSVGDFSFSALLTSDTQPLARVILMKLDRYEMEIAHAWFLWLLIAAFLSALFFIGCSYVVNRKSSSSV